jgi:hypothetical protein
LVGEIDADAMAIDAAAREKRIIISYRSLVSHEIIADRGGIEIKLDDDVAVPSPTLAPPVSG